jgi:arylsulfatase A-like enzyme
MADDFNHWLPAIGYYPHAKTPNLDQLASRGVLFTRAYSASPVCNPSRNALWSGKRPAATGIMSNDGGYIRETKGFEKTVTLNQFFTDHNYHTLGAGKLYHPGQMGSKQTDPDHWSELYKGETGAKGGPFFRYKHPESTVIFSAGDGDPEDCADTIMARHIARWISNRPVGDKPFFIGCGFFRPHLPWNCPKQFYDLYDPEKLDIPIGYKEGDLADVKRKGSEKDTHSRIVKDGKWKEAIRAYLANLSYADFNVGIVLDALAKSPHRDDTIVVFCGDHGWHLGEKDRWSKHAVFDQANRTTFIIHDPSASGARCKATSPVSLQDIYPTLVELCGLPKNPAVHGNSLVPLLENPDRADWNHPVLISYSGTHYLKTRDWTYIEEDPEGQLYDAAKDPHEWTNLFNKPAAAPALTRMKTLLHQQLDLVRQ